MAEKKYDQFRFSRIAESDKLSFMHKYQDLVVGDRRISHLIQYELFTSFLGPLAGALGLFLRKKFYPRLFGKVGRGVIFGHHVQLRSPSRIWLGDHVVVDDYAMLSLRGQKNDKIVVGKNALIGRGTEIRTRSGSIFIGDHANIGVQCRITSTNNVHIGKYCLFSARCSIGGANHTFSRLDLPIVKQPLEDRGGVTIGEDVWFGVHVVVNDGVTVGKGAVIGAGAVVTKDIPDYAVAAGVPARIIKYRNKNK